MKTAARMGLAAVSFAALTFAALGQAPAPRPAAPAAPPAPAGGRGNPANQESLPVPTRFTSKIGYFDADPQAGASYPRVIQLQHYAAGRGQLIATYGRRGALPIYRSTDNGETWSQFSEVPNLRGQPCLYELPVRMGALPAGTILAAGTAAPGADPSKRALEVSYSTDGGKSWAYLSTLAVGGVGAYDPQSRAGFRQEQSPIWEPYLYADSKGRLIGYYSSETEKAKGYSQHLVHKVSTDGGKSWGPDVYDVAIADGLTRPGMTVVTKDNKGKYYMSYEVVGMPGHALEPRNNLAHFRTSTDGENFGDYKEYGTLIQDRFRQYPNGTPYIVWSPWGGPDGTLIASGRSIVRYDNGTVSGRVGNGLFINRKAGQGYWTLIETPIDYNPDLDGYSQTMIPLGDGHEILQLISVNNRIYYAKFQLPERIPEYAFPFTGPASETRRTED
jgi:hypothetical protein